MLHENRHNRVRDQVAREYHKLPPMECRFCGRVVPLPACLDVRTEFRYVDTTTAVTFIADVAALDSEGNLIAVIEVIDSHEPRAEVFEAQAGISETFYITPDAFADGGFSGWCDSECWQRRKEDEIACELDFCCECGIFLPGNPYSERDNVFANWSDDPHYHYCLRCAAAVPGYPQWHPPMGDYVAERNGMLPDIPGNVGHIFLAWNNANFWAMVWAKRTEQPSKSSRDESLTTRRLYEIENAFESGDWARGAKMLWPIAHPYMERERELLAWDPENCRRVATAWDNLREYLLNALPPEIQTIISNRPFSDGKDEMQQADAFEEESAWEAMERQWERNPEEARARLIQSLSRPKSLDEELN